MGVIEVKNLVKQYKGAKTPSVDGVSFTVNKGEFFAFLGPNGAGKTTSISILTTTLSKTSGEVKIAGFDVEKEARQVREKIGIIFQKPSLDAQLTAEQNIRFHAALYGMCTYQPSFKLMPPAYRKRVLELAEIVGIKDALFKPVKNLSGGMQRKLEIIRSLMHTPEVLFLDEPTQGLDAVSRRGLWDYIDRVRQEYGTTVFLTTHYIDEAENVDKVCIINHGKIAACQSPTELKQSLLRQELIVDAADRNALTAELSGLNLSYKLNGQISVTLQGRTAQELIARLQTPLTVLKIHEPSLEDAYIEFLNKSGGEAQ
ncbi:ATP-binding cassette domain-containing protein [Desulfitobacterium chlororespirans]|uniref:ABC-2 type transport system ATP-binding protein n=1 Tax=Desulfitobacterium chlororespirans DSM 11544 TaxID=1121395 RepID=A0A1M7SLH4_9FIRM|nr:ATP-binding cassette domain-containing protein [Desulfitobacterium chlororespirans]SHN59343.1 ABC-2 type transport system ATP-binding protein [Desulfitobacterium chlororespirans DSM 11544]